MVCNTNLKRIVKIIGGMKRFSHEKKGREEKINFFFEDGLDIGEIG